MDSLTAAAARRLAAGDPLGALRHVALRDDPAALALRGVAMAQLGEHVRARELLGRAARGFGRHEALAQARCVVAQAEVALALREFDGVPRSLAAAAVVLEARGDRANARHAQLIDVRRLLLLGQLAQAQAALDRCDTDGLPPALVAGAQLAAAEIALRSLQTRTAQSALERARQAAIAARVPALLAEVMDAHATLERPAARCLRDGTETALRLTEVETLLASDTLVVDGCRHGLCAGRQWLPLARRPVLFALARALARAWPGDLDRGALIAAAFRIRRPDETHRARLRVELGRLRGLVLPLADIAATDEGYVLVPRGRRPVALLLPPVDGDQAALQSLLADGAAWSTSALAQALGASQRTVQRALAQLQADGRARSIGRARAQRWLAAPLTEFTTILLLPMSLPLA